MPEITKDKHPATSAKIGTGEVGSSELASTAVMAGSYGSKTAIPILTWPPCLIK